MMLNNVKKIVRNFLILETESLTSKTRYRRFRITLLFMFVTLSITPFSITSIVSYRHYEALLESKALNDLNLNISSAKKTVESSVDELLSAMGFILLDHSFAEFSRQEFLDTLFVRLRSQYNDVVDLGVIDPDGKQVAYAGPYDLVGQDYSANPSFLGANKNQVYISTVFMGYRKKPHFVISFRKNIPNSDESWVLRATIDADSLKTFIDTTRVEETDDVFLVDYKGNLQLSSRLYGHIMEKYPLPDLTDGRQIIIREDTENHSSNMLEALAYLEGTPWILVLAQQHAKDGSTWRAFKSQLIGLFVICSIAVLLVIFRTVNFLGDRVREADQRREDIMSKAEHSNKLASIGRLAAGVAHEINNPLATIGQKAGLMADIFELSGDFKNKEKLEEQIAGIRSSVERGTVITQRLLGFARRMDITAEKVEVNNLITETLSFLLLDAKHKTISIETKLKKDLPPIFSDRGKLQQVILNIVNNALDAFEKNESGAIEVSTVIWQSKKEPNKVNGIKIIIADNGSGMPPEVLKTIFEPFFTTKETGKGTGLGLSITYGLVAELGGEISVTSEEGEGTTFRIILPLEHDRAEGDKDEED